MLDVTHACHFSGDPRDPEAGPAPDDHQAWAGGHWPGQEQGGELQVHCPVPREFRVRVVATAGGRGHAGQAEAGRLVQGDTSQVSAESSQ